MPFNILSCSDDKAVITFATSASEALSVAQRRIAEGAPQVRVTSTDGASLSIERLERIARHEVSVRRAAAPTAARL